MYNHLFTVEEVSDEQWESQLNPESEQVMRGALVDESILKWQPRVEDHFQFERIGFFVVDKDSAGDGSLVFNLTVPLKDTSKPKDGQAGAPKSRKEEQEKQLEAKLVRVNYNFRHMTNQ